MPLYLTALTLVSVLTIASAIYLFRLRNPPSLPKTANTKRRALPVLAQTQGWARRECSQCYFFQPEQFAELGRVAPAGAEAAKWLSPKQMGAVEADKREEFDQQGQPMSLGGPAWGDLGICHKVSGRFTFPQSQCEHWR